VGNLRWWPHPLGSADLGRAPARVQPSKGALKVVAAPPTSAVQFVDLAAFTVEVAKGDRYIREAPYANY
jgi:hypothetical protein